MISYEVWKFGGLCIVCNDDIKIWKFGSLEVYILCVMMISLEVWKFGSLRNVCGNDKFGSLGVWKFTYCV